MKPQLLTVLTALSVFAAQAAQTFVPGFLQYEFFPGQLKAPVEAGTAGGSTVNPASPDSFLPTFEAPHDFADNYAERISGFFVPAVTGDYTFNISADDTADLFLSTDENAANKRMIGQQPGWNAYRIWATDNGGGTDLQQRITTTFLDPTGQRPFPNGIHLEAGKHYYIEGVMNEFGGGDNFAVRYAMVSDPAPWNDGDESNLAGNLIAMAIPSAITITQQPTNTSAFAGTVATFSVVVATDATVPVALKYQWRWNGKNLPTATASTFATVVGANDNAAKIDVVISAGAPPGTTAPSVTSSAATLTIKPGATTVSGKLKHEFFSGGTRQPVENGSSGAPTYIEALSSFNTDVNFADNYANRISGYFTPATSGNYVFFVCSDDDSDLFLSTDDSPANKRLIAQETVWSNPLQWTGSGGNSDLAQKRSDQFSPDGGTTHPFATGIPLTAGTKYYIEGVHHEGGGGDNFSATFKLAADPDPTSGDPASGVVGDSSKLTGAVISYATSPVTTGSITNQPQGGTNYESQALTLNVGVQTDSELRPLYQWRKNGTNIPGAVSAAFSIPVSAVTDTGTYDVLVTVPNSTISLTSSAAVVTVLPSPFATGYLKYEYFPGHTRQEVEAGTAGSAAPGGATLGSDKSGGITSFRAGNGFADNYANRISGFFIPPSNGNYIFFLTGDDDSDLFLSTDENPANKKLIAQEQGWSNEAQWTTTPSGDATAKRSDQFTGSQWAGGPGPINLKAGQKYYIEGVHHEGGGGDNFSATYALDTDGDPTDGDPSRMTNNVIGIKVPPQQINITQQPQSLTVAAPNTATFTIGASTTGFYPASIQWNKNGTPIPGATGTSYTTAPLTTADTGAKYTASLSVLGTNPQTSQAASLTVTADVTAPTIVSAVRSYSDPNTVIVKFSEPLGASGATAANYKLNGTAASAAVLSSNKTSVTLTGSAVPTNATLTVTGVSDVAGNPVAANTTVTLALQKAIYLVTADPGTDAEPLTFPGDIAVRAHLLDRGFAVITARGDDVPTDGATALGSDLIIESSSLGSGTVETADPNGVLPPTGKFKNLAIPAIDWEASSQDAWGFRPDNGTTSTETQIIILDPTSPLAAGFPAGPVTVATAGQTISEGLIPTGAHLVGVVPSNTNEYSLYYYEKGDKGYNDFVMPERRVFFWFQDNTAAAINDNGWKLFDAAVDWALRAQVVQPPTQPKLTITRSGTSLSISWTGTGTLQSTTSLASPITWKDEGSTSPFTVTSLSGNAKFYRVKQ